MQIEIETMQNEFRNLKNYYETRLTEEIAKKFIAKQCPNGRNEAPLLQTE